MSQKFSIQLAFDGHPDRVCDIIADAILDEFIKSNSQCSVDIGVMLMKDKILGYFIFIFLFFLFFCAKYIGTESIKIAIHFRHRIHAF